MFHAVGAFHELTQYFGKMFTKAYKIKPFNTGISVRSSVWVYLLVLYITFRSVIIAVVVVAAASGCGGGTIDSQRSYRSLFKNV